MKRKGLRAAGILAAASMILCGCGTMTEDKPAVEEETAAESEAGTENEPAEKEAAAESETDTESETAAGSTFSIMGDSISTYRGYNPEGYHIYFPDNGNVSNVEDTWWRQVADDLELTLFVNGSSSGATVVGDSTGVDNPQCSCNEFRTDALAGPEGACPDRIIIYLGTNDVLNAIPLGDNDGKRPVKEGEVSAFSDAYTLMLDKLEEKYPLAEIYCCTLLPMGNYDGGTAYVEFVNGIGLTAVDYGEVIAGIAEARGLSIIDLYNCGVTVENLPETSSDGIHPTAEGMKYIAGAVEEALTWK